MVINRLHKNNVKEKKIKKEYRMTTTTNDLLYSEIDLENSLERIETIHFHQEHEVSNIRFTCYHAGHVLGAAMFSFDIAGVQVIKEKN